MVWRWAWVIGLAVVLSVPVGQASAAMTEEQVRQAVERAYSVTVLRIQRVEHAGREAFRVTIMNPGGDSNTAYQVNTIAIDAETGELIPQFRHRASGYDENTAPRFEPNRQRTDALETGIIWR